MLICTQKNNPNMKAAAPEKFHKIDRTAKSGLQADLTFDFPLQAEPALGHQHEKDRVGQAEQRREGDVRQAARPPVIKCRRRVSQFVKRADQDQIRVPQQIAARDQGAGSPRPT
jgi:hypothetical protein